MEITRLTQVGGGQDGNNYTHFRLYYLGYDEEAGFWTPDDAPLVEGLHIEDCSHYLNQIAYDYWVLGEDEQPDYITDIRAKTNAEGWIYAALVGQDERVAYYVIKKVNPEMDWGK